jgi:hypothetical protein
MLGGLEKTNTRVARPEDVVPHDYLLYVIEDHVWFEDRWMVASWCDE